MGSYISIRSSSRTWQKMLAAESIVRVPSLSCFPRGEMVVRRRTKDSMIRENRTDRKQTTCDFEVAAGWCVQIEY